MKKIFLLISISVGLFNCSTEDVDPQVSSNNLDNTSALLSRGNPNSNSNSDASDYNVDVVVSSDGSTWTYTITKTKNKAKDLSHFIIDLENCGEESASFGNIIYATVNGQAADLTPSEGNGTGCNPQAVTNNFIKVNVPDANSWVIVIQFDLGFEAVLSTGWIKAGTSCNTIEVLAPGCPLEEYCSFSQGFFFANGALNNGSSASWINGLTIGGITYTQAQGMQIWDIDRGPGGNQTLNGFFQLGAIRLSGVENEVQAHVDIIDAYFTAIGNIFNYLVTVNGITYFSFPTEAGGYTTAQVIASGSAIGTYIDANHCE